MALKHVRGMIAHFINEQFTCLSILVYKFNFHTKAAILTKNY